MHKVAFFFTATVNHKKPDFMQTAKMGKAPPTWDYIVPPMKNNRPYSYDCIALPATKQTHKC